MRTREQARLYKAQRRAEGKDKGCSTCIWRMGGTRPTISPTSVTCPTTLSDRDEQLLDACSPYEVEEIIKALAFWAAKNSSLPVADPTLDPYERMIAKVNGIERVRDSWDGEGDDPTLEEEPEEAAPLPPASQTTFFNIGGGRTTPEATTAPIPRSTPPAKKKEKKSKETEEERQKKIDDENYWKWKTSQKAS